LCSLPKLGTTARSKDQGIREIASAKAAFDCSFKVPNQQCFLDRLAGWLCLRSQILLHGVEQNKKTPEMPHRSHILTIGAVALSSNDMEPMSPFKSSLYSRAASAMLSASKPR
jgi:hypothetical protein